MTEPMPTTQFHDVCHVDEIPEGEARTFEIGELRLGIFHVAGEFFALNDSCPHAGAWLSRGYVAGDVVSCRIHHWRFCIRNGAYLDHHQPKYNVPTYELRIVGERIQVRV